jgi:hypothetical protein
VQLAIAEGSWRENWQAKPWAGEAVANVMGWDPAKDRKRIISVIKTWVQNGALKVVQRTNEHREMKPFVEVGQWQNDTSAAPGSSAARQSTAAQPESCRTPTPPPEGVGGAAGVFSEDREVRQ